MRLNPPEATWLIYVGKAIPPGERKGAELDASAESHALCERLRKRTCSAEMVSNLIISDFTFRRLVVDDVWISLGETLVIQRFQPL